MGRKILLVEGNNDKHVVKHICGNRGVPHLHEVRPHDNVERLLEAVPVRLKASEEGDIVGVVLDADERIDSRWRLMHGIFANAGIPRRTRPTPCRWNYSRSSRRSASSTRRPLDHAGQPD